MNPRPVLLMMFFCAACSEIPDLEGSNAPTIRNAAFPRLAPLQETLGPPIDPVNQATEVEEELTARSEALARKAAALQNAQIN